MTQQTQTEVITQSFEDENVGDQEPADPWYLFDDGGIHKVSDTRASDGDQSFYTASAPLGEPSAIAVTLDVTSIESIKSDVYIESGNPSFGNIKISKDSAGYPQDGEDNLSNFTSKQENTWHHDLETDISDLENEHTITFWVDGNNAAYWDNIRFLSGQENGVKVTKADLTGDGTDDIRLENDQIFVQLNGDDLQNRNAFDIGGRVGEGDVTGAVETNPTNPYSFTEKDRAQHQSTTAFEVVTDTESVGAYRVTREYNYPTNDLDIEFSWEITLHEGDDFALLDLTITNIDDEPIELDQDEGDIHDGMMVLKGNDLVGRSKNENDYRFHLAGQGTRHFQDQFTFETYSSADWGTVFDDQDAATYGHIEGNTSPKMWLQRAGGLDFQVQETTLDPSQSISHTLVVGVHAGGASAPNIGQDIYNTAVNQTEGGAPSGKLTGTIINFEDDLPSNANVYAIDALHKHEALDYVGESQEELPPHVAQTTLNDDGSFDLGSTAVGSYVVIIDFQDPFDPILKDNVTIVSGKKNNIEIEFTPDRPLKPLADTIESIHTNAVAQADSVTEDAAEVYFDGYNIFENPNEDWVNYLSDVLTIANFVTGLKAPGKISAAAQIKSFAAEQTILPVTKHGYHESLAAQWDEYNGTAFQEELDGYTNDLLDANDIINFEPTTSLNTAMDAFFATTIYNESAQGLDSALTTFNQSLIFIEPPDGFSMSEMKDILQTQESWFKNDSLAPGMLFLPDDIKLFIGRSEHHNAVFDSVKSKFNTAEELKVVAQGIQLAGTGLTMSTVGATAGTVAMVGGWAGSMVLEMYQLHAKNRLADTWTKSLTYWVSDLRHIERAYNDEIVSWLETELENPTNFTGINGTVETDLGGFDVSEKTYLLANEPEYPWWWVLPEPLYKFVGPNEVEITNTGTETVEARVLIGTRHGDAEADDVKPSAEASMYPPFDEEPETLAPGESTTFEVEFSADFEIADALSWHAMTTTLWMDGKFVEEIVDTFYVVPSLDFVPDLLSVSGNIPPVATDTDVVYSVPRLSADNLKPANKKQNLYGKTNEIINKETLEPQTPTHAETYSVPDSLNSVVFLLSTVPGADINLHVRDEEDRHVGFDPAADSDQIEIPGATYNGSESALEIISVPTNETDELTIEVIARSFTSGRPVSVTVQAIEIPDRDAVMSVAPTTVDTVLSPGQTTNLDISVREIGKQTSVTGVKATSPILTDPHGNELPDAPVGLSPKQFDIPPGENQLLELTLEAAGTLDLPDVAESRYNGTATIASDNAGEITLDISVLILDTDVESAQLTAASSDVLGVSLFHVDPTDVPVEDKPKSLNRLANYKISSVGDGDFSIALSSDWETDSISIFHVSNGNWRELSTEKTSSGVIFTLAAEADGYIVIGGDKKRIDEYGTIFKRNELTSSGALFTKIDDQEDTSKDAKAGVIVRNNLENTGESSGYVICSVTPSGFVFQWDSDGNGFLDASESAGETSYPAWLELEKSGTTFTGYYSTDGSTWNKIGSAEIPSAKEIQDAGMFATSGAPDAISRVEFGEFSIENNGGS